jgi:hypothetical protein
MTNQQITQKNRSTDINESNIESSKKITTKNMAERTRVEEESG